jgi:hypothetical protein
VKRRRGAQLRSRNGETVRPGRPSPTTHITAPRGPSARDQFPDLYAGITIRSERELTVEIVAGEGVGFCDRVEYQTVVVRDDVVILSWQEHIGSTIVHVFDLGSRVAHTAVTPAKGGFLRLTGLIEVKSGA